MSRALTWLLLACGIGSAVSLGFAVSAPRISTLDVVVRGWLVLASVILLAISGGGFAQAFGSKSRLIASQGAFLGLVAFGTYVLLRGRGPWPGAVLLVAAGVTEAVLVARLVKRQQGSSPR